MSDIKKAEQTGTFDKERTVNRKRLRILAKFLRGIERKHFDMRGWVDIDGGTIKNGTIAKIGCGTTACAMGWATTIPSFHRDGLRLRHGGITTPMYRGQEGEFAASKFFDIDYNIAHDLLVWAWWVGGLIFT